MAEAELPLALCVIGLQYCRAELQSLLCVCIQSLLDSVLCGDQVQWRRPEEWAAHNHRALLDFYYEGQTTESSEVIQLLDVCKLTAGCSRLRLLSG